MLFRSANAESSAYSPAETVAPAHSRLEVNPETFEFEFSSSLVAVDAEAQTAVAVRKPA